VYIGTVSSFSFQIVSRLHPALLQARLGGVQSVLFALISMEMTQRCVSPKWSTAHGEFKIVGQQTFICCTDSINASFLQKVTFESIWSDCFQSTQRLGSTSMNLVRLVRLFLVAGLESVISRRKS